MSVFVSVVCLCGMPQTNGACCVHPKQHNQTKTFVRALPGAAQFDSIFIGSVAENRVRIIPRQCTACRIGSPNQLG